MNKIKINIKGLVITIVLGSILYIVYQLGFSPYRMNLFMDENKSNRFDWLLKDSILKHSKLVYSMGRKEDKFFYVYDICKKYYLYIYEIKEYNAVDIDNIKYFKEATIKTLKSCESGYYGSPWLIFNTKRGSIQTRRLKFHFSNDTKLLKIEKTKDYIFFKSNFKSVMIGDQTDNIHFNIYYEEDKIIPTDFLILKKRFSFFLILIRKIDNRPLDDCNIFDILNLQFAFLNNN